MVEDSRAALLIHRGNQLRLAGVGRHGKAEMAALAWCTLNPYLAPELIHQFLGNVQAET